MERTLLIIDQEFQLADLTLTLPCDEEGVRL
jgi:hypothetical protein